MLRLITLALFLSASLFAASPFGDKIVVPILELDSSPSHAYTPAMDLKVGESGEIVRWLDENHSTIIAHAVVMEIKEGRAKITFGSFNTLNQPSFPTPLLTPQIHDKIIFRAFYDRAFLIAPHQDLYQKIQAAYPEITWQHPDLFASYLLDKGHRAPHIEDFRHICEAYNAGIVYIVGLNEGQARDCRTFALLHKERIVANVSPKDRMKPFFSRLGNIESNWFDFITGNIRMKDYYLYYDALLKGSLKDKDSTFFGRIYRTLQNGN